MPSILTIVGGRQDNRNRRILEKVLGEKVRVELDIFPTYDEGQELKDLHTGKALHSYDVHRYEMGGGYVGSAAFSRDGRELAAGIVGYRPKNKGVHGVQVWDVKTGNNSAGLRRARRPG